jgi:hypothetical protein
MTIRCPVCDGEDTLWHASWFDEEGVEGWECDQCETGWLQGWDEPPSEDDDPWKVSLMDARASWREANEPAP